MVQDFVRVAARIIIPAFLAHFLQDLARIGARLCKKMDISRARAKQVLHARFLQDSCTILQVRLCWEVVGVSWLYILLAGSNLSHFPRALFPASQPQYNTIEAGKQENTSHFI